MSLPLTMGGQNRRDFWGEIPGRYSAGFYRAAAAGNRIRASQNRLAVALTITGGFSSKGTEKVHVWYTCTP
jgi:hypothetical protein